MLIGMTGGEQKRGQASDWRIRAMPRPRRSAERPIPATRPAIPVRARVVGGYVPKLTKKVFEKFGFSTAQLITDWPAIVGDDLARACEPERMKWPRAGGHFDESGEATLGRPGATLILRVDPARALDVEYQRRQIIERVNSFFGYKALAEMRIIQAPLTGTAHRPPPTAKPKTAPPPPGKIPGVDDPNLSTALARLQASIRHGKPG